MNKTKHTAQFSSKANIAEIVKGTEVSTEGKDILQITRTDDTATDSCKPYRAARRSVVLPG